MKAIKFLLNKVSMSFLFIGLISIIISSCNRENIDFGEKIPQDVQRVKLSEVLNNPLDYNSKKVVFEGILSSQCPALCDFSFKDDTGVVTMFPQQFKLLDQRCREFGLFG